MPTAEFLTQAAPLRFRHGLEFAETFAQNLLLLRRQIAEALEALTDAFALFRAALTPLLQALRNFCALQLIQGLPVTSTLQQALLTLGLQLFPFILQRCQCLALAFTQRTPGAARLCLCQQGQQRQQQQAGGSVTTHLQ
jgi:hypothetical protein